MWSSSVTTGAELSISGITAKELAKEFGTPTFFLDEADFRARALAEFPRVVASAAEFREPHRIARYLEELAGTYHGFYNDCRVLPMGEEKLTALHTARLLLCTATKQVIANGLDLLGVSAPERM